MLLVEGGVGLGAQLLPTLLPGLVAAAVGYVLFVGLGSWGGLNTSSLQVPGLPEYHGTHLKDLAIAIAVGIIAACSSSAFVVSPQVIMSLDHGRVGVWGLLIAGGFGVGGCALVARWIGADSQDVLFSGQASVPGLVDQPSTKIVIVLLVAKALAYAISLGAGFRGGPVFPAIFLGIAVTSLAEDIFHLSPNLGRSGWYCRRDGGHHPAALRPTALRCATGRRRRSGRDSGRGPCRRRVLAYGEGARAQAVTGVALSSHRQRHSGSTDAFGCFPNLLWIQMIEAIKTEEKTPVTINDSSG